MMNIKFLLLLNKFFYNYIFTILFKIIITVIIRNLTHLNMRINNNNNR